MQRLICNDFSSFSSILYPDVPRCFEYLTHLSLASLLWDIGKQNSPRWDAAAERGVPSGAILFAKRIFIKNLFKNLKITPDAPKNESGLAQMIKMGKSIRQIWVNVKFQTLSPEFLLEKVL